MFNRVFAWFRCLRQAEWVFPIFCHYSCNLLCISCIPWKFKPTLWATSIHHITGEYGNMQCILEKKGKDQSSNSRNQSSTSQIFHLCTYTEKQKIKTVLCSHAYSIPHSPVINISIEPFIFRVAENICFCCYQH